MKKNFKRTTFNILLTLAFIIFTIGYVNPSSATFIDFESYPSGNLTSDGDPIDTQFVSWGISLFTSEDDIGNITKPVIDQYLSNFINYPSGISALAPWRGDDSYYGTHQAPIKIYFNSAINYFSVYALDVGYNGLLVNAYDINSSLISSVAIDGMGRYHNGPPNGDGLDFIEFNVSGISSISFSQIHSPDWDIANGYGLEGYLLDDITFHSPAPEPSTILLFIFGFIGIIILKRKYHHVC